MKRLSLVVAMTVLTIVCHAQKVDLDRFNYTYEYRDLPKNPLNPEYKTYSINISASASVRNNYGTTGLEDMVNIEGLKKVTGQNGHVIVTVNLFEIVVKSSQVTERIEVQKDKDGKETGRKYYYKATLTYTWEGKAVLKDYKDAAINSYGMGSATTTRDWSSSEYTSYKEAADYYNNNRSSIVSQLIRKEVDAALADLSAWASNNYGYPVRKDAEILWILDNKKHPETPTQKEAWEKFKSAVASINANEIPESTKQTFDELLKYFDSMIAKYTTDDKGDKKMRYAGYYNKAKIYLHLDQPEAAIKEADALVANDYDAGDGKRLRKEAETLIESFKKNNTNSRHFPIDLSAVQPPAAN